MASDDPKTERMRQIRKDRKEAGFKEVTVWVPGDLVGWLRSSAWALIDKWHKDFPHKDTGRRKAELIDAAEERSDDIPS